MNLLFEIEDTEIPDIQGLCYIPDFITKHEEQALLDHIDSQPWLGDLKRRVQHYGYKYDYKARTIAKESYIGALPEWINIISSKLCDVGIFQSRPDQAIVNEYMPGQGIAPHIDCTPCFGDTIASLSLGSAVMMQFIHPETKEKHELYLKERSLIALSGEARYDWQHAIPARKSDVVNGFKIDRGRRVSLTFRTVNLI